MLDKNTASGVPLELSGYPFVLYSIEKALTRRKPCTNHTAMYFGLPDQFQRCCAASGHGSEAELGSYVSVSVESASF